MNTYDALKVSLAQRPATWLVTGCAGFVGSNLLETLLRLNQRVLGLDNFATGYQRNLDEVRSLVTPQQWANCMFVRGDIQSLDDCRRAMKWVSAGREKPVEYVLHQAALGSVPRSIEDPIRTNAYNIDGFLNMLVAARDAGVKRFVYAASSSTYGDHPGLPKVEERIGEPLSPYAVTKLVNELYADVFGRIYGLQSIGLRYFNIVGKRQDPDGPYAAVIPRWISALLRGEPVFINGDGETSRDFCYIDNAVQANLLAAMTTDFEAVNQVYNVAVGDRTTLNQLFEMIVANLVDYGCSTATKPRYRDFRAGDVRHSMADIGKARERLGYVPSHRIGEGLKEAIGWYVANVGVQSPSA